MSSWEDFLQAEEAPAEAEDAAASSALPPISPLFQGMSYGLAGNLGLLPKDYAKQRAAHNTLYPFLEGVGETITPSLLLPEYEIAQGLGRAGTFAARTGYNALVGAGLGAASTNVGGGDVVKNAEGGALDAAALAPLASVASALAPKVSPKVASYLDSYSNMFGSVKGKSTQEMGDEISKGFESFIKSSGGIDVSTVLPEVLDKFGNVRYPSENLAQRLTRIQRQNFSGQPEAGKAVTDVINDLATEAATNSGKIDAAAYLRFTQRGGSVSSLSRSSPTGQVAGGDIRQSLDDALEAANPADREEIDALRQAYQLWRIADGYASGGKQSAAKLARLVDKHFRSGADIPTGAPSVAQMGATAAGPSGILPRIAHGVEYGLGGLLGIRTADLLGSHIAPMIGDAAASMGVPGLAATGIGAALVGGAGLAGAAARRSAPMVRASIARALGQPNPLLVRQISPIIGGAAVAGANAAPGPAPVESNDPWAAYFNSR